jgi:hypothetical protein
LLTIDDCRLSCQRADELQNRRAYVI